MNETIKLKPGTCLKIETDDRGSIVTFYDDNKMDIHVGDVVLYTVVDSSTSDRYIILNTDGKMYEVSNCFGSEFVIPKDRTRIVSQTEREDFFNLMKKFDRFYNDETHKVEKVIWKPNRGDQYFYLNSTGIVVVTEYNPAYDNDFKRVMCGNCFKTEIEARTILNQCKKLLSKD